MVEWRNSMVILFVTSGFIFVAETAYTTPDLLLEALKSSELRVYMPDVASTTFFVFHANINEKIAQQEPGTIVGETRSKTSGYWVLDFKQQPLKIGDTIYYWAFIINNNNGYYKFGSWEVSELLDSFTPLVPLKCTEGHTTINGGKPACIGKLIIEDDFTAPLVDTSKWIIEQKIPTYTGPNYEFNAYKNRGDVRFIRNSVLYLKPKALKGEDEVRGTLNLREGCTSDIPEECFHTQSSAFLLPPVVSAKIRSKVSFKYGKVEIRARFPSGDWIYPIVELEEKDKNDGENAPKIWIAYSRGNNFLRGSGSHDLGSRLLFGGPVLHPAEPGRSRELASQRATVPYNEDFHVYTLEWTPGKIVLYVDSILYGDISTAKSFADPAAGFGSTWSGPEAPFNKEYVLSLGAAVGGLNDFPDGYNSEDDPKPWINGDRNYIKDFFDARNVWSKTWKGDNSALQIDYVKVTAV